ncbi:MAG TPA: hypothetical protein VL084_06330 [Thermoanaerobaculia bacterium]|nr:hypothetical protein [Thermoanaerobaculia bacterium]
MADCVPEDGNLKVWVNVETPSPVTSARVYFHSVAKKSGDYYLELRQGNEGYYWAILPYPVDETTEVQYRIVVKNADGLEASTAPTTVPTRSSCTLELTNVETRYANNLVIGLTSDSQPAIPDGFRCKGVVGKITAAGDLKPAEECRQVLAAAAAGATAPTAGWIGGAAFIAGATAISITQTRDCHCEPVSSARPVVAAANPRK